MGSALDILLIIIYVIQFIIHHQTLFLIQPQPPRPIPNPIAHDPPPIQMAYSFPHTYFKFLNSIFARRYTY